MQKKLQTITEQVYQQMKEEIVQRALPSGEALTVRMLQDRYGISSSPIREALAHLQQDGLIEYRPNIGIKVVTFARQDMDEIFAMMEELDVIALRFAVEHGDHEDLLKDLSSNCRRCDALIDDEIWPRLSDEFHIIFYRYANNSRLETAAEKIRTQFTVFSSQYEAVEENRLEINGQHRKIFESLEASDAALAEKLLREHIESSCQKALRVFEGHS